MAISCNKALHPREYHQNGWLCSWLWLGHRATRRGKPSWGSGNVSIWQVALGIAERHAEALTHLPLWEAKGNKHRATAETHGAQGWLKPVSHAEVRKHELLMSHVEIKKQINVLNCFPNMLWLFPNHISQQGISPNKLCSKYFPTFFFQRSIQRTTVCFFFGPRASHFCTKSTGLRASQDAQDALAGTGPARCSVAPLDTILLLLPVSGRIHLAGELSH